MKKLLISTCCLFSLLLSSCSLTEKYHANNAAGEAWLQSHSKRPARANFKGVYYSPNWNLAILKQREGKLTGYIGSYNVKGIVSGENAYLLLIDDSWVDYTMILQRKNYEIIEGSYSSRVPFSEKHSARVQLDRIVD